MKKVILFCLLSLFLFGCEGKTKETINTDKMKTICIEGVSYFYFKEHHIAGYKGYGFMSVKFNKDGTVSTCEE